MTARAASSLASAADLCALADDVRAEVIRGVVVEKASPTFEHGEIQFGLGQLLGSFRSRGGGPSGGDPGWWFATECDVQLEPHEVYRRDVAGWRKSRVTERPHGRPVLVRPDWVCEILSASNASNPCDDTVQKFRGYQRAQVPHYWMIDPDEESLTVHRWTSEGYLVALRAMSGEAVRAEPFEAIELRVSVLLGLEEG